MDTSFVSSDVNSNTSLNAAREWLELWFLFWIFLAFVVLALQQYLEAQCEIKALVHYTKKTVKLCSLKRSNNGGRINKRREKQSDMPDSDRAGSAAWCSWFQQPSYQSTLLPDASYFYKVNYWKLIMRLELNMQIVHGSKRTPSSPLPAVLTHESMDCQVRVYRTDICYLYTCSYIWSPSDFPLDMLFECLWGKHQGFLEWFGFLKFCLFLYLFYMNWKFCQTYFDCMENMFHRQKTVRKKKGSCNSIKLGREERGKPY